MTGLPLSGVTEGVGCLPPCPDHWETLAGTVLPVTRLTQASRLTRLPVRGTLRFSAWYGSLLRSFGGACTGQAFRAGI